jgi:hypothetical protein
MVDTTPTARELAMTTERIDELLRANLRLLKISAECGFGEVAEELLREITRLRKLRVTARSLQQRGYDA